MKTPIVATIASILLFSGYASAQVIDEFTFVRLIDIQAKYSVTYVNVPETQCYTVNTPEYTYQKSTRSDILTGVIIGGLLGDAIGGDDRSAAIGALIGGVAGSEPRKQVSGYQTQRHCETIYIRQSQEILDGYTVTYIYQNTMGVAFTPFYYPPGTLISARQLTFGQ
jgi:uncharacterized protein YcfJ